MAKQEIWIRFQDDLSSAYSVLRSLIDNEDCVCGIDMDLCRLLFRRISDIKDNKSLQIEFDDLPDNEKTGRAKKMLEVLMQYHLNGVKRKEYPTDKEIGEMSEQELDDYTKHAFDDIADYSKKVRLLNVEMQKWERDFSRLIYDVEMFIIGYYPQDRDETGTGDNEPQQYTKELIWLFNGHTDFIDKLRGIGRQEIARKIAKWCMMTHKDKKCICQQGQYLKYARNLVWSGLVPIENDDEPNTINNVRNQLQNADTRNKQKGSV